MGDILLFNSGYSLHFLSPTNVSQIETFWFSITQITYRKIPRGGVNNELNCIILVNEFECQSHFYVQFQINTLGKQDIGKMVRVFTNGPGDLGSIPGRVIPKTQKMVLDAPLLNTQHYKVNIKGKVDQFKERSSVLSYTLV